MGKALYRKYRSQSLDDVVGQQHITDTLKSALKKNAISHAYLFTGPRGTGKTSVARILAYEINELPYSDQTHLDIIEIDAASNRRIDEIRDLRDKVHIAPTSAQFKVYIIDEVHMLTREAFNALLKTLEEPPEHAVFILATTELHKVPETIVSRTQRYTFKPISNEHASSHLSAIAKREKLKITDDALEALAVHGRGSFRDSISMLDQLSGLQRESYGIDDIRLLLGLPDERIIEHVIDAVQGNDTAALFAHLQSLKEQGTDVSRATQALSSALREDIMNGSPRLSRDKALTLLKELLPLTNNSTQGYIALELAALSVMDETHVPRTDTEPKPRPPQTPRADTPVDQHSANKQETNTQDEASETQQSDSETTSKQPIEEQIEKPQKKNESPADTPVDIQEQWNKLLNDVKGTHNTLYGILRMAQASFDNNELTLTFNFGFHKKRVESDDHKRILSEYLESHFGTRTHSITVSPQKKKTPNEPAKISSEQPIDESENSEDLESISNIFGDAELLD